MTGENLDGATVTTAFPDVTVIRTEPGADSHYLFVWLKFGLSVSPGVISLRLQAHSATTTVRVPLFSRSLVRSSREVSPDDVIYLIMPDRFADGDQSNDQPPHSNGTYDRSRPGAYHGGDLRGIREHLPYLHGLGVTTLWLTPVWKNTDSDYHGYHCVDFYALDDHMGTMQEYQNLVADAHRLGMKVLIDYVVNHTGPKHPWITDPPSPGWFHGTPEQHMATGNQFSGLTDPHGIPRQYRDVLEGWFADKLPDLNPDNPLLAQYLVENALWWTEGNGLDGFRLDTFPYSSRRFWSGWHESMRSVYPGLGSIGEVADGDPTITSFFQGGRTQFDGVDSRVTTVFDFPLYYALREVVLRGAPVQKMIDVLRRDSLYPQPDLLVTFIGNHDGQRFMGEAGSSKDKLKAAFSLLLTIRGIPQIYSGDEIGMQGGDDPDNRRDFPGGFPGDPRDAFIPSGRTPDEEEIFTHVESLLRLRQAHPALRLGHQWHIGWDDSYYAFLRESAEEKLLVIFNNASVPRSLTLTVDGTPLHDAGQLERLFGKGQAELKEKSIQVALPATSLAVYYVR